MFVFLLTPKVMGNKLSDLQERAEKGEVTAQAELGAIYQSGNGVTKNTTAAIDWLKKAAEQGHGESQMTLGRVHLSGKLVKKDSAESAKWFLMSAQQGNPEAQAQAARMYMAGAGVQKDDVEAYKWASAAATQQNSAAKKILMFLGERMTPVQIKEGKSRTHDYLEGKRLEATLDSLPEPIPTEATEPSVIPPLPTEPTEVPADQSATQSQDLPQA